MKKDYNPNTVYQKMYEIVGPNNKQRVQQLEEIIYIETEGKNN